MASPTNLVAEGQTTRTYISRSTGKKTEALAFRLSRSARVNGTDTDRYGTY